MLTPVHCPLASLRVTSSGLWQLPLTSGLWDWRGVCCVSCTHYRWSQGLKWQESWAYVGWWSVFTGGGGRGAHIRAVGHEQRLHPGVSWALQMLKGEDKQGPRRIFHSLKHSLMWTWGPRAVHSPSHLTALTALLPTDSLGTSLQGGVWPHPCSPALPPTLPAAPFRGLLDGARGKQLGSPENLTLCCKEKAACLSSRKARAAWRENTKWLPLSCYTGGLSILLDVGRGLTSVLWNNYDSSPAASFIRDCKQGRQVENQPARWGFALLWSNLRSDVPVAIFYWPEAGHSSHSHSGEESPQGVNPGGRDTCMHLRVRLHRDVPGKRSRSTR